MEPKATYTAFAGERRIASGDLESTLLKTKQRLDLGGGEVVLVFDDQSGRSVDFDFQGTPQAMLKRLVGHPHLAAPAGGTTRSGPGRPRLGIVSREISLLPRHWAWLEQQPQGLSATLRRLVEEAKRREPDAQRAAAALAAADRFMAALAGDRPGYEEASRALYARDWKRLRGLVRAWPKDVRGHVLRLARVAADQHADPARNPSIPSKAPSPARGRHAIR